VQQSFRKVGRSYFGVLTSIALVFAALVATAPLAGATTPISLSYVSVSVGSATSLNVSVAINGTIWSNGDTITFSAYDVTTQIANTGPYVSTMTQPSGSAAGSCTVTNSGSWNNGGSVPNCTISSLTTGHAYAVWVSATASQQPSVTGAGSQQDTYVGVAPTGPTINSITPGNGSVTVSYTLGALGTFPYSYSNVSISEGSRYASCNPITTSGTPIAGTTLSCTVLGLVAGSSYSVSVYVGTSPSGSGFGAFNGSTSASGTGTIGAPTASDAPSVVAAIPSISGAATSMLVYVSLPANSGGNPIQSWTCTATDTTTSAQTSTTGYATYSPVSGTQTCNFSSTSSSATPWNFSSNLPGTTSQTIPAAGLVIGDAYTFTATVTTTFGTSSASAVSSFSQVLGGAPNSPTGISITTGSAPAGGLNVQWNAATSNGAPVTAYAVSASPQAAIDTSCSIPVGANIRSSHFDAAQNLYILYAVSGSVSLKRCALDGTSTSATFTGVMSSGGFTTPVEISTGVYRFYGAAYYSSMSGTSSEIDQWTYSVSGSSATLTKTLVGVYSTAVYSTPLTTGSSLVSNADGTVFYSSGASCISSCSTTQLYQFTLSQSTLTGTQLYSFANGVSGGTLTFDQSNNLWMTSYVANNGPSGITYTNGQLLEFSASQLVSPSGLLTPAASVSVGGLVSALEAAPNNNLYISLYSGSGPSGYTGLAVGSLALNSGTFTALAGAGGPTGFNVPGPVRNLGLDSNGNILFLSNTSTSITGAFNLPTGVTPPANSCTVNVSSVTSTYSCVITGLATNFYYSVSVIAQAALSTWIINNSQSGTTYTQGTRTLTSLASATSPVYAGAAQAAPPAVTGVSATTTSADAVVVWTPGVSNTLPSASTYEANVYLGSSSNSAGSCTVSAPATTCTITGLSTGVYTIKVKALNPYAQSSNTAPVTTGSSTLSVTGVSSGPVNQASLSITSLSGTVGSALSLVTTGGSGTGLVTFATSTSGCSINGAQLSASSATTCVVTATKASDSSYNAVSSSPTNVVMSAPGNATTCPAGSYLSAGNCLLSPVGSYATGGTSTAAIPCSPGTYQQFTGASSCSQSPIGFYVDQSGAVSPVPAPVGYFDSATGEVQAHICLSGTTTTSVGQSACSPIAQAVVSTKPSTPLNVVATMSNGTAIVSFSPGSSGNLPTYDQIDMYINGVLAGNVCNLTGASSCSVANLGPDVKFTFTVTAINSKGSAASALSNSVSYASPSFALPTATTTTTVPPAKKTITCVKGASTKKVTALNPVCPAGYKKK